MSAMASQITGLTIAYSNVYSGADQRKHQSSASLAFVEGIHPWIPLTKAPNKGPIRRKMLPFDDVIMKDCGTTNNRIRIVLLFGLLLVLAFSFSFSLVPFHVFHYSDVTWCHDVSDHRHVDCLLIFTQIKHQRSRFIGSLRGESTGHRFPSQRASNAEMRPCHDVIIFLKSSFIYVLYTYIELTVGIIMIEISLQFVNPG